MSVSKRPLSKQLPKKLTYPQRQALQDIERCGDPSARVFGQSRHGGWNSVMRSIQRNAWARYDENTHKWVLTDLGQIMLQGEVGF